MIDNNRFVVSYSQFEVALPDGSTTLGASSLLFCVHSDSELNACLLVFKKMCRSFYFPFQANKFKDFLNINSNNLIYRATLAGTGIIYFATITTQVNSADINIDMLPVITEDLPDASDYYLNEYSGVGDLISQRVLLVNKTLDEIEINRHITDTSKFN